MSTGLVFPSAYWMVASICRSMPLRSRFQMTAATTARSAGTSASLSIIDAMMTTSYSVRLAARARRMSTLAKLASKAVSWSSTKARGLRFFGRTS